MDYIETVLTDPLFSTMVIGGLVPFALFGQFRFYTYYLIIIFTTFTDETKMQAGLIILAAVLSFHIISSAFTSAGKTPLKDVT